MGEASVRQSTVAMVALALIAASCAPTELPAVPQAPPPLVQAPAQPSPEPEIAPDACGAGPLQYLVGRPRSQIPVPVDPSKRRVTCSTCPVPLDYREDRLNIIFDADTGTVLEVKCG
jgi:hypothetical protein